MKQAKKLSKRPYILKLNQAKIDYYLADLCNKHHSREMKNNYDLTKLLDTMSEMSSQYFPNKKISRKQYKIANNPWITSDILNAIKSKDKIYAKYLKERSLTFYSNYKKCKNKSTYIKNKAKQKYFENLFSRIQQFIRYLEEYQPNFSEKSKPTAVMPITIKSNRTQNYSICNKINEHFVQIGEKLGVQINKINDKAYTNFLGKRRCSSVYLQPTDSQEIIEIIACLS